MIKNYLKVAFRNLVKYKGYSFINVLGLAIGIAGSLLIFLWVTDELNYDRFHEKAGQIYRVGIKGRLGDTVLNHAISAAPMADAIIKEFPEVLEAVRLRKMGSKTLNYKEKYFYEERFYYVDPSFFQVFSFPLLEGDIYTALSSPYSVVLTQSTARKYFGEENPMGKTLKMAGKSDYKVTGVAADVPSNSHFHFDLLFSFVTLPESKNVNWSNYDYYTYIVLRSGILPSQLEANFPALVRKSFGPQVRKAYGISYDKFLASGNNVGFILQPLTDIHLHSELDSEMEANGDISYVYILSALAVFILLIACINFINLATARSAGRAKEVGLRKVMGSMRINLFSQFLTEAVVLSTLALILAMALVAAALPFFNNLVGKQVSINFGSLTVLPGLIVFAVFIGIVAGSYPAFFLSSFSPIAVLKGKLKAGMKNYRLRNILVVFQFSTAIILFISTFTIYNQLEYMQDKKLGYNDENVLAIQRLNSIEAAWKTFKTALLQHPDISGAAVSNTLPGRGIGSTSFRPEGAPSDQVQHLIRYFVGYDFARTLGMEMVTGRFFSRDFSTDSEAIVINEAAAKLLGWPDPIGKHLSADGKNYKVIGMVKDFHFESMHREIRPLVLVFLDPGEAVVMSVRLNPQNMGKTMRFIEDQWKTIAPGKPFEYFFLDDNFKVLYGTELRVGRLFIVFSIFAIFVACLGLFGLTSFTVEQRRKEIGIRKVVGAAVSNIVFLLSRDFIRWVLLALGIGFPIAYILMSRWLQNFAYRESLSVGIFILSAVLELVIALLTVSFQSIRAAFTNPVDTLKYE